MIETPRPTKGETTRAALIEAAHELFVTHGYHATSVRAIARHAGLALSGIYNHFESKEAIFVAVLESHHPYHDILPAMLEAQGATAEEYLSDAARRVLVALKRHPRLLNIMLIELVEFEGRHVGDLLTELYPRFIEAFGRTQQFDQQLRPLHPIVMMRAFLGLFFSHYIIDMLVQHTALTETAVDWFGGVVDIFLHGVVVPYGVMETPR